MQKKLKKSELVMHKLVGEHDWGSADFNTKNGFQYTIETCIVCGERRVELSSTIGSGGSFWQTTNSGINSQLTSTGISNYAKILQSTIPPSNGVSMLPSVYVTTS